MINVRPRRLLTDQTVQERATVVADNKFIDQVGAKFSGRYHAEQQSNYAKP